MRIADKVERTYAQQAGAFADSRAFQRLESGVASREDYDRFLARVFITHFQSPKVMAFLLAVAPPSGEESVKHNLMEEMGLEEGEKSHPELLKDMLVAAGFDGDRLRDLEDKARGRIRDMVCDPLLYGTLMETGLAVLLEASAFEWMLSRLSRRMGDMLSPRLGLEKPSLAWFYHHGEVDIRHAKEALETIEAYCAYYGIAGNDLDNILEITFRENVFYKHYLGGNLAFAAGENAAPGN